jgi:uncharacterized protein (DUF1499 family)
MLIGGSMPKWTILATVGALLALAIVSLLRSWPVVNAVETGRTPEYPDLQPRQYQARRDRVFDAAVRAVGSMPRWTLAAARLEQGEIRAEARTRLFRFVDDVVIRVAEEENRTVVNVRSASRVGRGDFGQNARNVRAFLAGLDRQMDAASGP